jgi:hypothetical protein
MDFIATGKKFYRLHPFCCGTENKVAWNEFHSISTKIRDDV